MFAGFDGLCKESNQCFFPPPKWTESTNVGQCSDDVDLKEKNRGGVLWSQWRCLFTCNPHALQALRWRKTSNLGGYWTKRHFTFHNRLYLMFTFIWTHAIKHLSLITGNIPRNVLMFLQYRTFVLSYLVFNNVLKKIYNNVLKKAQKHYLLFIVHGMVFYFSEMEVLKRQIDCSSNVFILF